MLEDPLYEPPRQVGELRLGRPAVAEVPVDLQQVVGARLGALAVPSQGINGDAELFGDVPHDVRRRGRKVLRTEAKVSDRAKGEREPKAVGWGAPAGYRRPIGSREGKEGVKILGGHLSRKALQSLPLGAGEKPDGYDDVRSLQHADRGNGSAHGQPGISGRA